MSDGAFGEMVFQYSPAPDRQLTLFQGGFRGFQSGQEIAGRWEDVAFVKRSHVRVIVLGMERDNIRAEIHLHDGRMYLLAGTDEGASLAARYIATLSGPVLAGRMMAQLQAPGGVMFGLNLRATPEGLHFRKGSGWKTLRFDSIAGYKVFQGHVLIDENPTSPRLAQQIRLAALQNPDAFLMLMSVMAPDKDLDEKPYPFDVSFFATSAATHDPRYLSMRARGIGCLAFLGVGVLAGIVALIVNAYYMRQSEQAAEEFRARREAFKAGVDSASKAFATAPVPTGTLREACAGKGVSTSSMLAVVTGAEAGAQGLMKEPMPWFSRSGYDGFDIPRQTIDYPESTILLVKILDDTALADKDRPRARLHVRVVGDPAQPPVCEGVAEAHWKIDSLSFYNDLERREPLLATAVMGLCEATSSDGVCRRTKSPLYVKAITEGAAPAPSGSASASAAPKGKAPPKRK